MQARSRKMEPAAEVAVIDDQNQELDDAKEVTPTIGNQTEAPGSVPTPSIANFFTKCSKLKSTSNTHSPVLVKVDVHKDPSEHQATAPKKNTSKLPRKIEKKAPSPLSGDTDIVFLGSETVDEDEADKCGQNQRKRSYVKISSQSVSASSKEKVQPDSSSLSQKDEQKSSGKGVVNVSLEQSEKKKEFLHDSKEHPDTGMRQVQATLSFGSNGSLTTNKIVKAEPMKPKHSGSKKDNNMGVYVEDSLENNVQEKKKVKSRSKQRRIVDSDSETDASVNVSKRKINCTLKTKQAKKSPRLRYNTN
jgi:hypothetical protein